MCYFVELVGENTIGITLKTANIIEDSAELGWKGTNSTDELV